MSKKIAGMTPIEGLKNFRSKLQIDQIDDLDSVAIANPINDAFVEAMKVFPLYDDDFKPPVLSECDVFRALKKLNLRKALGPDDLPNWLLNEFAGILAQFVRTVLNCTFAEQRFPSA